MFTLTDEMEKDLIQKRRYLHENPELAFEEVNTTAKIKEWLQDHDIPVVSFNLETGVIAEIEGELDGPTIAIRADIDALPIAEATDVPFKSKTEGKMHACGHDFHTVSILGTAILLNEQKEQLRGKVRIIFQPAEEIAQGAKYLVDHGVLKDVTAIFGMHNKPDLPVGTIGVKSEGLMASVDKFEITFNGIGGHAGIPHHAIDPIVMASQYVNAVQSIISRRIDLFHNAVISITSINGGNTWNVIPDKVVLQGTVRTFQPEARDAIPGLMKKLAETTADGNGGTVDFKWDSYLPVVNNAAAYEDIVRASVEDAGYQAVDAEASSAGEDFAYYQNYIPGFFVWMGVNGPKEWHHPEFDLSENAIKVAAEFFATLAVKALENE
ncbi:amidohydrolase [Oceanobacillus arenosus]|uniref:Amidohydrolase n=1 Tax=Oceanobacillus arenosus TaxID=1229153 RepID=A0A3D8PQ61_9BACI|nr:amidohydrolase [Oceanobacillus arenosus]RDW18114.1 amidohydrolase [Oceanobacillus arenosus]